MSVQYDGKSPGKLWYFWQNTKAMLKSPWQYETAENAKKGAKNTGYTIGSAVAWGTVSPYLTAFIPIPGVGLLFSLAASVACFHFGMKAYHQIRAVKNSSFTYGYVREQENKWLHRKAEGNVFKRGLKSIKDKIHNVTSKIPLPVVKAAKYAGWAAAAAGLVAGIGAGLSYAGVPAFSTGATATAVLGGIAQAGAVVGLSAAAAVGVATGLAVAAIPLGILLAVKSQNAAIARNPEKPVFKKPSTSNSGQPIDRGVVFTPKAAASFEFNAKSDTAEPVNDALTEERRKAAEARKSRKKDFSNKF